LLKGKCKKRPQQEPAKIVMSSFGIKKRNELRGYLRSAFNELAKSNPHTYSRRNALASILIITDLGERAGDLTKSMTYAFLYDH